MRKKLKELLHKEEGFTLVELLAVIVILGIIIAIAVPVIGNVTQGAQSDADAAEEELIIDAAQMYELNEKTTIGSTTENGVTVKKLVELGYLQLRGENPNKNGVVRRATTTESSQGENVYILENRSN